MAVDFAIFNTVVPHVIDAGFPVLVRGRHGIGKSELVYQIADDLGLPVVERRASQMTEGDLMGLPSIMQGSFDKLPSWIIEAAKSNGVDIRTFFDTLGNEDRETLGLPKVSCGSTRWNAPDWLKEACDNAVILFLDEVDRATMEVRQGIFELTDSRKLNGWHLHPQTRIFAAVNGGEHAGASSYQVGEMDPAELDRWTVFDVEPTVGDWLAWAKTEVDGVVWDFINQNHAHLEHMPDGGGYEPNKVYPSRRSWKRFSDCVDKACFLAEPKQHLSALYNLACGFLGFEAAVAFRDFCEMYERIVTLEDVIDRGQVAKTADFGINDHLALCEKLEASGRLNSPLTPDQVQNLADWFVTLPSEVAMKLFAAVGACEDNSNIIALHAATTASGKKILDFVIELVG